LNGKFFVFALSDSNGNSENSMADGRKRSYIYCINIQRRRSKSTFRFLLEVVVSVVVSVKR
jgi:hypothetical protein